MSGGTFYDDLHILDLTTCTWSSVKQKKIYPSARAAHAAVSCGNGVYVFGGIGREGALDDIMVFDTSTFTVNYI